ncbi:uncharacterized protein LOC113514495 [Galleria mellonella]|uniref:Uncharacterized protein LOC113514495 n=1 Tax=Galleria mellonella TaxID=7137 RepID=A0A6J1WJL1_GALME|nr:uncharacterized protein LOC113514495 [Galleria mellonella]
MEKLTTLMLCENNSCCCLPKRVTIIMISLVSLAGCVVDTMSIESCRKQCSELRNLVDSIRTVLITLFQMANLLLLLASLLENSLLVQIYVWYTMGFVVMGLTVSILEFLVNMKWEGRWSFVTFVPEVAFFLVFIFILYFFIRINCDKQRSIVNLRYSLLAISLGFARGRIVMLNSL